MRRLLPYSSLIIVGLAIITMFVTATTYLQLAIAIIAYPVLAYFAFKAFPRKAVKGHHQKPLGAALKPIGTLIKQTTSITDVNKRGFLKLIGAAGVSFFLFSLLGKRPQIPFLGKLAGADNSGGEPTDSYRISEVADGAITYYGFIKQGGAWFIMQEDTNSGSFRYVKGSSNFPDNWANRERLQYDYYHNVF